MTDPIPEPLRDDDIDAEADAKHAELGLDPRYVARQAFLRGEPIGSPSRPASIGGIPFVARPRADREDPR